MSDILGIVLDAGSKYTKAGIAGEPVPRAVFPTAVGRFRLNDLMDSWPLIYCGHEAIQKRGVSQLTWPVQDGMINDWEEMEKLWHHVFYKALHVPPEQAKVLHAVHPLTSRADKERMTEILFEVFTVDSLYLALSSALVLHASGRTTGVVWENGHSCSYASPVFEGFPLKHATVCSPLTGKALTDHLSKLLMDTGYSFTTPIERDLVHKMKADLCYVAQDYEDELKSKSFADEKVKYLLPDGQHILLGQECFKCPEILFQPTLSGLHCPNIVDNIVSTISQCDLDFKGTFYENIVVSGGSSMFPGLVNRLKVELMLKLRHTPDIKAKVDELSTRQFAPWAGGSIIGSLSSLKNFWMTKEEYDDHGLDREKMAFEKPVVVIDNGSYTIKAGFACDNHPVSIFRTVVGRPSYLNGAYGRDFYNVFIGDEAVAEADLDLNHPVVKGRIVHWDNMERIWHHIFYRELKAAPEDRAVMLGLASATPMVEKIKCCEVFFETLNAPGLCVQPQSVLSLYGSGYSSGLCVDLGYDTTNINPVYEGGLISYAHMTTNLAGVEVTKYLKNCLQRRKIDLGPQPAEVIEDIKKNYLFITQNKAVTRKVHRKTYTLPSGEEIDISEESFMAAEILFAPDDVAGEVTNYMSIQNAVVTSSLKCDAELRTDLYEAIVPCGGMAMLPGLNERLAAEVEEIIHRPVNVIPSNEAYAVSWLGGATFAGMPDAQKMWVLKKQFEEHGANIVRNKFLM